MNETSWESEIKKHFGYKEFTTQDAISKINRNRVSIYQAISYMKNKSKIIKKNGDRFRLLKEEERGKTKSSNFITVDDLLRIISEKFGDESFTAKDMIDETGGKKITVYGQLRKLCEKRLIKRESPGVYTMSTKGHNRIASCCKEEHEVACEKEDTVTKEPSVLLESSESNSLLKSIESTWEKDALYKWATRVITKDKDWKAFGEELIGKAALSDLKCRKILEEKVAEAIHSLMPK